MVSFRVKENKCNQMLNYTKFILVETLESVMLCSSNFTTGIRLDHNFQLRYKPNTKLA